MQIALLRWYEANQSSITYNVSHGPTIICFDGSSIWVADYYDHTVTKLQANDGTILGTYSVGNNPNGICFDGANIWVVNFGDDTVSKL